MDFELKSVQHTSQRQDHKIQTLNETLKSKEKESEELYRVIEGQNETIAKLQDTLHKTQLGQLQIPGGSSMLQQTQPGALLEVENTLFFTQLEVQQLKTAQQKKDLQLAEARKTSCLVETWLQEEQQQKEAAWKHNQELRCALQQVRTELQNKNWQCCTLERERWSEMQKQELKLKHLKHRLACREQLLQESKELIQYHQSLDKSPTSADNMVKKLQQRIKDRDAILERAVDEKFCVLEDKEQELQQLRLAVKEREHDLEELRRVLSHNEATIQGMESLLKAKGLELEQLLTSYQNLRWLKEEVEAKSLKWQAEQEGTIRQLQAALHDRNKKVEALSAKLLCKLGPGQRELVEELYLCLQQKEQIIEELLSDKSRQTVEQMAELQELLQAVHTREQQSCISSEKMARALIERSCELQDLRQQLQGQLSQEKMEASTAHLLQKDDSEALRQESSSKSPTPMTSKNGDGHFNVEKGAWKATAGLEEELTGAKEQLELLTQKEKESRLELAALQSVLVSQEEELQVQASDVESLTRSIQIKEELIKDLQMQLVDPEEMPVVERLSQEVLMLQEKVAKMEQQGQEVAENRRLQLLQVLEGLAAEKNQLNETLKAEKQLYSTLVKFQAHPDSLASSQREQTLQVELDRVQAIRGQLEEALGRSLAHLSRLESLDGIGGPVAEEDAEDASTEFTDSIEEEAQRTTRQQHAKEGADGNFVGQSSFPAPSLEREKSLQAQLLSAKSETQQLREQKKKLEGELQHLKGQIEEAGFSSMSQLRKALLSLCLENAELKEQVGEAMLSEGWENEDEKEEQEDLKLEVRKLQEKLHSSEMVIGLLKEQLTLSSQAGGSIFQQQVAAGVTQESEQLQVALQGSLKGAPHDSAPQRHCPRPQSVDTSLKETQVWEVRLGSNSWQQLRQPVHLLPSELPQCKKQCHRLRGKLLVSEATVLAQVAQLEQYRALLSEPTVQQDTKQIQVDLQDLGYETCGKSENEADREEATSPECEEHDMFHEELKPRKNMLGSPPSPCDDAAILRQQVRDLQLQLQSSHRVIQNLQSRVRSISATSDYGSGGERPLQQKPGYALGSSPSHSMTEEDEGWYSNSLGSFCPASLQPSRDLARLIQRVSLLEAHLGESKPKWLLAEELKPAASMGKYNSLVQAQARELSHLRQVIREGRGVCHLLKQHFQDTIKSFEELLRGTDFDYFLGQSFREQLAQGSQWAERLASKLNRRNDLKMEDKSSHELLTLRLSKELQEKEQTIQSLQAKLHLRSVTPSSSRTISESPRSGSSTSFLSDGLDGCSDMDEGSECVFCQEDPSENQPHSLRNKATSPAAPAEPIPRNLLLSPSQATQQPCRAGGLLEEHLSEIQILRQRLEESISANDHLREQLEKRLSLVPKSHELEQLQEALLASHSKLHDGEMELHQQRAEQQRLQEEIRGKQQDFVHLQEEFLALQKNNSRLQHRVALLQQQCEQNQLHFQTLQAELQVYKLLCGPQLKVASGTQKQEKPVLLNDISSQGSHVISHLKDYSTLKKQILEGKTLIHKMASLLHPGQELQQSKIFCQERIRQLLANMSSLHQILEKSASLLATFWRATLPGPHISAQEPSRKEEIQELRARLAEPESRLRTAGHGKESMESVLLSHLTRTYDVLRKARMNLEGISPQPLPSCDHVLA
ncbi:SMYLE_N domain-containing protein [Podarcis lilfordi]|uniref:SMYLE_N domain-containing protein n=1 Tax=Podarcis lilfordi TaxID=74358 RepID=A0AA35P945_9SAUR|nr:SMYLE_N domain-containing protein [Podarcis lilfordi]